MRSPSALELQNTDFILGMLVSIDGIAYTNIEPDIFRITGPEGAACILDVEESLVCISEEICSIPEEVSQQSKLFKCVLDLNSEAIHGKFATSNGKLYFKENLEIKNINQNELEAALGWTLAMVARGVEAISDILNT
jgi:hypothetical protein